MRTIIIAATLVLYLGTTCSTAFAQPSGAEFSAEEQRVLEIEDEYVVAEVKRDEAALRRILDDRFVWNRSNGSTSDKEAYVQGIMSESFAMVGQSIRERSILVEGDVAFVFGTADLLFARPGKPETKSPTRYTAAYIRRHDQWRMIALQMQPRSPE